MHNKDSEENQENLPAPIESREIDAQKGTRCANCGRVFNREKIFCPVCGLRHTEDAKLPSEIPVIQPRLEHFPRRSSRIFALLSFILGVAGPLALGIGWLLAIIFGFTALNIIRNRGGFAEDKKLAIWGTSFGFMWPVAIGFFILFLFYHTATQRHISRNETAVVNELKNIAVTQKYIKSGWFFDRDNDGESEYADFEDLSQIDYLYFDAGTTPGQKHGYSIQMEVIKEQGFYLIARPLVYGTTGKKVFYVDQTGILRGAEIKQVNSFKKWGMLPKVKNDSVFEEFDNEIAGDLLNLAKNLARKRNFQRAEQILTEIKKNYYLSPAVSELNLVTESITACLREDKAKEDYENALKLIENGQYRKSLSILKDIERSYPDILIIAEVKKDRVKVEKTIVGELEEEAKKLFAEAENLELQGKYDEALSKYNKIVNELDSTSCFPPVKELIPLVEKKQKEKKAEVLFAELCELKPVNEYTELLPKIDVLLERYPDTELVKNKKGLLSSLRTTAQGYKEKDLAIREFREENFQAAVQAGEEALQANPALREDIKPIFEVGYIRLAEGYSKTKEITKAVACYQKWMEFFGQEGTTVYKDYIECVYQLGKTAYLSGNYQEANKSLLGLENHFADRDEFWYLLGSIAATEKKYEEALNCFSRALSLNDQNGKAWHKSGLCRLSLMKQSEEKLPEELKRFQSLKRGMDIVIEAMAMVNDLNFKHIELEIQETPKILEGKTQLTPDQIKQKKLATAERAKFVTAMRNKFLAIEKQFQENELAREDIKNLLKEIYAQISAGYRELKKASSSTTTPELDELLPLVYKKTEYFASACSQTEPGLNYEKYLEQKIVSSLQSVLFAFDEKRSPGRYIEDINRLYDPFWRKQMNKNISEGRASAQKALSIKISVENYLAVLK